MANRHLSRSIVLQSLFEWDFNRCDTMRFRSSLKKNSEEFGTGLPDDTYIEALSGGILKKQKQLDAIIERAAPDWPLNKISIVDRNVLRIGLHELLYADRKEVPPKVAINEAIELAKTFGGENSGKFVNGVLGTVYKEIGEPGKNEISPNRELDPAKMPKEFLGGAVIVRFGNDGVYCAFVHDVFGYWTLSKGHIEEGEDPKSGTAREIKEELGIDVEILDCLGENEYTASDPEKGKIRKHVYYFLAKTDSDALKLESGGGLLEARWFSLDEIADLKTYGDMLPIITKGIQKISEFK